MPGFAIYKHYTMTKAELNRAIKKFANDIQSGKLDPLGMVAKTEFLRLHGADNTMRSWNVDSWRIMVIANRRYSFIRANNFGPLEW